MNKRKATALLVALLCGLLVAGAAWALSSASYAINWDVVPGGGGHASAGSYTVDGSAGQPVMGTLSGGSYSLAAGFWPGIGAEVSTPTPTVTGSPPPTATPTATPSRTPTVTPTLPITGIRYVAPTGSDAGNACTASGSPCRTIQHAVDQAEPGEEVRMAAGIYSTVQTRDSLKQVVYVDKTVVIRGGYTTANWTIPDPAANPTTLDAVGLGRVMVITGTIAPTVEGLRLTGGDATGLGGRLGGYDAGGGLYVYGAAATISNCVVISNTASTAGWGYGGGVFLWDSAATLSGNTVQGNIASTASSGRGGGAYLTSSGNATLNSNTFMNNSATYGGGGLFLDKSNATLNGNTVTCNTAIRNSTNGWGGGVYLDHGSDATLNGNIIIHNTAVYGGGFYLWNSSPTLINTLVAENQALEYGSGILMRRSSPRLLHTTIANNGSTELTAGTGGYSSGVYVTDDGWGNYSTVALTNTILFSHTVGITVATGNTVTLNATLWHGNTTDWGGAGTINHSNDHTGDPAFDTDGYHLTLSSAAIDQGVDAGVTTDIDGDVRPQGTAPDLGADEYPSGVPPTATPTSTPTLTPTPTSTSTRTPTPTLTGTPTYEVHLPLILMGR